MSSAPKVFGLDGRTATLLSCSLSAAESSLWLCHGAINLLSQRAPTSDSPIAQADSAEEERDFSLVSSFSYLFAIFSAGCALVGFSGAYSKHLPWLRFYALYSVAEAAFGFILLASLGVLAAMPGSRQIVRQAVCAEITSGAQRQYFWSTNMLESLEGCEESIQIIALPLWFASVACLLLKWHFVNCTLAWYHWLIKRRAIFGKDLMAYESIPLSPSPATSSISFSASSSEASRRRARTLSTSLHGAPKLSLVASPYQGASPPHVSPISGSTSQTPVGSPSGGHQTGALRRTPSPPTGSQQKRNLQRRNTHVAPSGSHEQLARQNYLVYAPVALLPLDEAKQWAASGRCFQHKSSRDTSAFAAIKGSDSSSTLPSSRRAIELQDTNKLA